MTAKKTTRKKTRKTTKKNTKNPLYVVTNQGKDVEMASGFFDAIIKKLGLAPAMDLLNSLFAELLKQVQTYASLKAVQQFVDDLVEQLKLLIAQLNSLLARS